MRAIIFITLLGLSLVTACGREAEISEDHDASGQVSYIPNATVRTVGFDTVYKTEHGFSFTVPKEWVLMQSTNLWAIQEDGTRAKLEGSLDAKFSNVSDDYEQLLVARQFLITDPATLVSISLLTHSGETNNTQSGLKAFTLDPEFDQSTEEFRRRIEDQYENDSAFIERTWIDGGVQKFGDWLCKFYVMDFSDVSGEEKTDLWLDCPNGAKTINVIGITTRENRNRAFSEISRFIASMDASDTDWVDADR